MTLIMIWRDERAERLWAVSDSRLSNPGAVGRVRLTDHAAKLLEVTVSLSEQTSVPGFDIPTTSARLGFAYTGSSLVALQAYAAVLPLWGRLQMLRRGKIPSLLGLARHLSIFASVYSREVGEVRGQGAEPCEIILMGATDVAKPASAVLIQVGMSSASDCDVRELPLGKPGAIEIFGSGRADAEHALALFAAEPQNQGLERQPLHVVRRLLGEESRDDIGGGVQIGFTSPFGFQISFDVHPPSSGSSVPQMRYRGFDFMRIAQIEDAWTSLVGMA